MVEHWPTVEIRGAVADVCVDARRWVYAGVRNPREDGSVSNILGGGGYVLVLDREAKTGTIDISIDTASIDTGPHELARIVAPMVTCSVRDRLSSAAEGKIPR